MPYSTEFYQERLSNYAAKLGLSKRKAVKRLTLAGPTSEKLALEFDRIVDDRYQSHNLGIFKPKYQNKMEIAIKVCDLTEGTTAQDAINEAQLILNESAKVIDKLILKNRVKIDLVGELCNLEIKIS